VDDYSEMEIVSRQPAYVTDRYAYFSLLNISGLAQGITVQNAKYPLSDAEITCEYPYGISNEPLPGQTAKITVKAGRLLLIRVWPT
jgi:thiamine pyrophosphokinase